jgi:hypothetical protein
VERHQLPEQQSSLAPSVKTQRVAIPLTSVPPLPVFQHHLQPTQLRTNSHVMPNEMQQIPFHNLQNVAACLPSPSNIHLPDPLELTADFDDNACNSANLSPHDLKLATNTAPLVARLRLITLPSPLSSAAPTPRDYNLLPVGDHRNLDVQHPHSDKEGDLLFISAAHMQSAHNEQQHSHRPQSPTASNVFDRQSSQPFAADLSPVPPAMSPPSLINHDPPPPHYSPLPVRSVLKLESAIQACSSTAGSLSDPAPVRSAPQTSLAIITGYVQLL